MKKKTPVFQVLSDVGFSPVLVLGVLSRPQIGPSGSSFPLLHTGLWVVVFWVRAKNLIFDLEIPILNSYSK